MFSIASILFVLFYAAFSWFHTTKVKPVVWMVANVAVVVAFGLFAFLNLNAYLILGVVAAVVNCVVLGATEKTSPVSDWKDYLKMAVKSVLFYPTVVFEQVYGHFAK